MDSRLIAKSVAAILAAALPETASAQPQSGEAQVQTLYPRADGSASVQRDLGKPTQRDLRDRLERVRCAGSAMCAWRRVPKPGEHIWRGYGRGSRAPR